MQDVFHIGIPKSGTTTIQHTLYSDDRIKVSRSRFFTSKDWWLVDTKKRNNKKVVIESNETLISGGFQKVKFSQVVERIYNTNPCAKIIVTIREQEDAILSMYKYHISNNFKGTNSIENWMFRTNLGMDYLSICMYGNIAKILLSYFPKEQIHFLFFEELKENPEGFYNKFYTILGIDFKKFHMEKKALNVMPFSVNQLYTLSKLNQWSFTSVNGTLKNKLPKIRTIERRIKKWWVAYFSLKSPHDFFSLNKINGMNNLRKDFKRNNNCLIELGFVSKDELERFNYLF